MSIYKQNQLDDGVITGFVDEKIKAWHQGRIDADELIRLGRAFNGPVPAEVAERLIAWEPTIIELPGITGVDGTLYTLPDRLSKFVANPNSSRIVNIAGAGYDARLHITMREAIQAAMDANADIASVVCLGDGAHMGMSFRAGEGVVIGGDWGGAIPLVGFNSSLTGAIATQIDTSSILRVCDNTMAAAAYSAKNSLKVKRTKHSGTRITPQAIRDALDIAFEETSELCAELERLANVSVTQGQLSVVLNEWKPVPNEPGRAQTIAMNQHNEFMRIFNTDPRNVFGQSVAGLWQSHNTWQHWSQTMRGFTDDQGKEAMTARLDRMAMRTAMHHVEREDEAFMALVAAEFPELVAVAA
jgi:hypothetical protein